MKWEQIFLDFERGEYIDVKTLQLMKDKKGYKPKSVVKNDLKHARGLTEVELDMAADQCLVTREGEKYPRNTLKTIGDWAFNRKKKNETYIAMAECLDPTPRYVVTLQEQKKTIDRDEWKAWKVRNNFGRLQRERLLDLLGSEYLSGALNPAKKKVPIPARFKEGVRNILVTTVREVSEDHLVLSIDNNYHFSGVGECFLPITHALMDTRFLPGVQVGIDSGFRIKEIVDATLQGIRRDFPGVLEAPLLWTVVSEFPDRHFIHNVLKTYLPSNVRFCEALYHGCKEEKIGSRDCFFEESSLRVTSCIFPDRGESSSEVAVRICGGRKMLDVHDPRRYMRYSVKRAYLNEASRCIFKGELRMQTYIDIIKPSSLEGTYFLNICGGNKAHVVANVSIDILLYLVRVDNKVYTLYRACDMFCPLTYYALSFSQALGMKVVNIVPLDVLDTARDKMLAAADWSMQRWSEEGKASDDDIEDDDVGHEVDSDIDREMRSKRVNDTYQVDSEEEEEDDVNAGHEHEEVHDEEEEDDEAHTPPHEPLVELGASDDESEDDEDVVHGRSPVGSVQDKGDGSPSHGRSPVGGGHGQRRGEGGQASGASLPLPVASFTSGIPPTPGRNFVPFEATRSNADGEECEEEQPTAGTPVQAAHQEDIFAVRFTSKPMARRKVKAVRKGRKSIRDTRGGEASRSSDDMLPSSLDGEGDSGGMHEDEAGNVGGVPLNDTQPLSLEVHPGGEETSELNVSSPVEEVAAAVLEVLGQGRPHVESSSVAVEEHPAPASPSKEDEMVIRTEVICLDSDDEVPERRVELDVRVKVRDRVPYRVRGTFADYITDDSEDEDYGQPGYNRVKLNFTDDPHPVFAGRPPPTAGDKDKGKESDEKDKVHFVPFVDKYLSEVPENVRLNLAHMYRSYDYHKMFAYLSTPAFCQAVKVKHILHAASLKKMRKRWKTFESRERHGRGQFQGSTGAQAESVVDSTLEIIDISGVQESPSREVHVGATESSSPRGRHDESTVRPDHAANPLPEQSQGIIHLPI